jgi:hypothetical protein
VGSMCSSVQVRDPVAYDISLVTPKTPTTPQTKTRMKTHRRKSQATRTTPAPIKAPNSPVRNAVLKPRPAKKRPRQSKRRDLRQATSPPILRTKTTTMKIQTTPPLQTQTTLQRRARRQRPHPSYRTNQQRQVLRAPPRVLPRRRMFPSLRVENARPYKHSSRVRDIRSYTLREKRTRPRLTLLVWL